MFFFNYSYICRVKTMSFKGAHENQLTFIPVNTIDGGARHCDIPRNRKKPSNKLLIGSRHHVPPHRFTWLTVPIV